MQGSSVCNSAACAVRHGVTCVSAVVSCALILGRAFIAHKLLAAHLGYDRSLELDSQDCLNISVADAPFLHCFGF